LGRGEHIADVLESMTMVAEGVRSSRALLELAHTHGVDMPITEGVVAVCHGGRDPRDLVDALLARAAKPEIYGMDV
jgi:glycerol-3-phosphate dehydrogenase (NAD(P)+)